MWIETIFFCRFNDAESCRARFGTRRCVGEQPVFSADNERLDASLCTVIVNLYPTVLDVAAQIWLFLDQIIDRLAELTLRSNVPKRFCPCKERVQKRFCLLLSLFQFILETHIFDLLFNGVQLTAVLQTDSCRRAFALCFRQNLQRLAESSSGMCPTADDRNIFDSTVCLVAVRMQIPFEFFQKALGILCLAVRPVVIENDRCLTASARPIKPHVALGRCRLILCFENLQGGLIRMKNAFFK